MPYNHEADKESCFCDRCMTYHTPGYCEEDEEDEEDEEE